MSSQLSIFEQELDELAISVKAYMALHERELTTIGDVVGLHEEDLHEIMAGDQALVDEVICALAERGLHLSEDHGLRLAKHLPAPDDSWGCLHVWCEEEDAMDQILGSVAAAYMSRGLRLQDWATHDELDALLTEHIKGEPTINRQMVLAADEVLVMPEETAGWYAVMSSAWELSTPTRHPLARALSADFSVVAITALADHFTEVTRYDDGAPLQTRITGVKLPKGVEALKDLKPLELSWFESRGSVEGARGLFALLTDPESFGSVTGCEEQGFRRRLEGGLDEFKEDGGQILIFR
jgi:chorismate-pyruvate lyase